MADAKLASNSMNLPDMQKQSMEAALHSSHSIAHKLFKCLAQRHSARHAVIVSYIHSMHMPGRLSRPNKVHTGAIKCLQAVMLVVNATDDDLPE